MTYIHRITAKGFKSFANRTELVFGKNFNIVLGPNGSGKCVSGDTKVQLANGQFVTIKELVQSKEKNPTKKLDDGYIYGGDETKILCLDLEKYKVKKRKIQAYVKRTAPKNLLKIRTRSGREIKATAYHPLFILKDGKIISARADELKEGVKVAVPREIELNPSDKTFNGLIDAITVEDNLYVPWDKHVAGIIKKNKKETWKEFAQRCNVPLVNLTSLVNSKQAINFTFLIRVLRELNYTDEKIMDLIPIVKAKRGNKRYHIPWKNSPELARLLGYLLAEGRLTPTNQIWFTNGTKEIVEDYAFLFQKVFKERVTVNEYKPNCWDLLAYSRPLQVILSKFGMPLEGGSERKQITNLFLSSCSNQELVELLDGLYSGDGYVSQNSIELVTKSIGLAKSLQDVLTRLGILFQTSDIIKIATNSGFSGRYKQVNIYGVENFKKFAEKVKFTHPKKQNRLEKLLTKKANPNLDLIGINGLVKKAVVDAGINVKKAKKDLSILDAYCYNQCTPSRVGVQRVIQFIKQTKEMQSQALLEIEKLAYANIYWDEIIEINKIEPGEPWVYDLCVEEHHNFVANNFFVHNSNICDSICFVLGKTSAKSMRAEKSANLIYNGGKKGNAANQAEVTIEFDNKKKQFPIEEDLVKIKRIVKKNGTSKYFINENQLTRQQVVDVLKAARIDPDGHNIVLQGDIIHFMEMKPVERREIIDEIAGIGVYEEKKDKCLKELEKVGARLHEAQIILTEREANLRELKKERDQAIKYKEAQKNVKDFKATVLHHHIKEKKQKKENIEKKLTEEQRKVDESQAKVEEIKKIIKEFKEKINKINIEVEQKGEKEQLVLRKQIEELKTQLIQMQSREELLQSELTRLKNRKNQLNQDKEEITKKLLKIQETSKKLEAQKKQAQQQEQEINKKITQIKKNFGLEGSTAAEQFEVVEEAIEKKQTEITQQKEELQNLFRKKDQIEFNLKNIKEKIQGLKGLGGSKQLDKLKEKKKKFEIVTKEFKKAREEDIKITSLLTKIHNDYQVAQQEAGRANTRQATIMERTAADHALKKILALKNNIKGIYGTVAQLGEVDKKYTVALEIAAGARLQSLVVQTDTVAQKCIEYLKTNKLGVVTFLPLNKLKERMIPANAQSLAKKSHGLAIDLVEYDTKFKNVFKYVFGPTIIVDSINQARRLGLGQTRMVTLDGDVLEASGAMVGGYRHKTRGVGFQEKGLRKKLESYEAEVQKLANQMSRIKEQREKNDEIIMRTRKQKAELEAEIITLEKSMNLGDIDVDGLQKQEEMYTTQVSDCTQQIKQQQQKIMQEAEKIDEYKIKKQKLKQQLNNPQLTQALEKKEQEKSKVRERIIKAEAELKNNTQQTQSLLLPEKEKIQKILKQQEKENEEFTKELKSIQEVTKIKTKELKEKEKHEEKFFKNIRDLVNKRAKVQEKIQDKEKIIIKTAERWHSIEHRMNNLAIDRAKVTAEAEAMQKEFDDFGQVTIKRGLSIEEMKDKVREYNTILTKIGNVNLRALEVYEELQKEHEILLEKADKLQGEKEDVLLMIDEIEGSKKELFMKTYSSIEKNFTKIFSELNHKGTARVELEDPQDPFNGGIDIQIELTKNKRMDLKSLSGGEKTMAALAFIFAIQEYEPSGFYLLDEVDAALDKKNSEMLSQLIRKYANGAQYVVISHNDTVITEADQVYGVSMQEGISKVISLKV